MPPDNKNKRNNNNNSGSSNNESKENITSQRPVTPSTNQNQCEYIAYDVQAGSNKTPLTDNYSIDVVDGRFDGGGGSGGEIGGVRPKV